MIAYAVETLPEKAAKFIIERETGTISNVQDRVNQFQRDLDGAIRQFGAFNSEMEREKGDMHKIAQF